MRQRADWLTHTDERILELMRSVGNLTPLAVEDFEVTHKGYAAKRLSELHGYGLVRRISRGLYTITDDGEAFLDEELDASTLERRKDVE